eukprot:TRINITY_DN5793_c0_g1_i4.p1 TRINITY_DN5793_c0_g1~~TRINITY_DN5793_c0_g1_i4.p1  ORF type:complete len:384 (-),score=56.16 TRINITY_DN5793_c0_g1_i4:904-2055(-)
MITKAMFSLQIAILISGQIAQQNDAATAVNQLSQTLLGLLCPAEKNCAISGYSIFNALGLAYAGAKAETQTQIQQVVNLSGLDKQKVDQLFLNLMNSVSNVSDKTVLKQANRFYGANEFQFLDSYLNTIQQFYKSDAKNLDFATDPQGSRQEINSWVEQVTKNLIENLLPSNSISSSTISVLVNALYFNATWTQQFHTESTEPREFTTSTGEKLSVPTMAQFKQHYMVGDLQKLSSSFIKLPYRGNDASMYILVPKLLSGTSSNRSIYSVLEDVDWSEIFNGGFETTVNLKLPKFMVDFSTKLSDQLKLLGMVDAFDGTKADFGGMVENSNLFIVEGYHKTKVVVDEAGTEAAAATALTMFESSVLARSAIEFSVDQPFAFLL